MNARERAVEAVARDLDVMYHEAEHVVELLGDAGLSVVETSELEELRLDAKSRGPAYQRGRADGRLEQRAGDGAVPAAAGEQAPGPSGGGLVGPPAPEQVADAAWSPFSDEELRQIEEETD